MCNLVWLRCCTEAPEMKANSGVEWRNNLENTREISRFLLWWLITRDRSVGTRDWQLLWCHLFEKVKDRSHGLIFFLFSLSTFMFSPLYLLVENNSHGSPFLRCPSLGFLSFYFIGTAKSQWKTYQWSPSWLNPFFFDLESQSAMPGIAGLATVGILIEAERQENWFWNSSICWDN